MLKDEDEGLRLGGIPQEGSETLGADVGPVCWEVLFHESIKV